MQRLSLLLARRVLKKFGLEENLAPSALEVSLQMERGREGGERGMKSRVLVLCIKLYKSSKDWPNSVLRPCVHGSVVGPSPLPRSCPESNSRLVQILKSPQSQ